MLKKIFFIQIIIIYFVIFVKSANHINLFEILTVPKELTLPDSLKYVNNKIYTGHCIMFVSLDSNNIFSVDGLEKIKLKIDKKKYNEYNTIEYKTPTRYMGYNRKL